MGYLDRLPVIREQLRRSRELLGKVRDGTATPEEQALWESNMRISAEQVLSVFDDGAEKRKLQGEIAMQAVVDLAMAFQPHSYEHSEDDDEAMHLLCGWLQEAAQATTGSNYGAFYRDAQSPFGGHLYQVAAKWCHYGFNSVRYDARYCASLLCTSLSSEVLDEIDMPWPAFVIEIPAGLVVVPRKDGKTDHVERLFVDKWLGQWRYLGITHLGSWLTKFHHTAQLLVGGRVDPAGLDGCVFGSDVAFGVDVDKRMHELLGRLVVNTCLALTDPTTHRVWAPIDPHRKSLGNARKGMPPQVRIYEMRKPVTVDCRPIVSEYLSSGRDDGRKIIVQLYVGSYWRRQPHGPGRTLRRWQQIEGHWKGPVDAPIAVRPHVLQGG